MGEDGLKRLLKSASEALHNVTEWKIRDVTHQSRQRDVGAQRALSVLINEQHGKGKQTVI